MASFTLRDIEDNSINFSDRGKVFSVVFPIGDYCGVDGGVVWEGEFEGFSLLSVSAWACELNDDHQMHAGDAVVDTHSVQLFNNGRALRVIFNLLTRDRENLWPSELHVGLQIMATLQIEQVYQKDLSSRLYNITDWDSDKLKGQLTGMGLVLWPGDGGDVGLHLSPDMCMIRGSDVGLELKERVILWKDKIVVFDEQGEPRAKFDKNGVTVYSDEVKPGADEFDRFQELPVLP